MSPTLAQRLKSAWPWLLLPAAIALYFSWGSSGPALPSGQPAPELRVPWSVDATGFDLSRERGHVVVLAFWATWCPACREEGPALSRVHRAIERHGDRVVGVSVDEAPLRAIERAARSLGMSYPIAQAAQSETQRFRVDLLPTIIVVDAEGRIAETFRGTAGEEEILEAVADAR